LLFDLRGWLMVPAAIDRDLLLAIREQLHAAMRENPPSNRVTLTGPCQELVDHPVLTGILQEIIAPDCEGGAYGFRCESSFFVCRPAGTDGNQGPHRGPNDPVLAYRGSPSQIYSGLTRVVWEINGVRNSRGGTLFLSGSHKLAAEPEVSLIEQMRDEFDGYVCPPGSLIVFTESCWHFGGVWNDGLTPRLAIFNCYNHYLSQVHRCLLPQELIDKMPERRRTAFRGVWFRSLRGGPEFNTFYSRDNQAQ
jgi:hypothetical protein